ncbi:MAG: C45 family autoproteolytic acyltransferase/hydrolase, partial [Planctomyces sp.]
MHYRLFWALILTAGADGFGADESLTGKPAAITGEASAVQPPEPSVIFTRPASRGEANVTTVRQGDAEIPLVVVRGTPYEMGRQLGAALRQQITTFIPPALQGICGQLGVTEEQLQEVWSRTAAYADDRLEQELAGVADAAGLPLKTLQAMHAVPLLMPYSCSSIAAWGDATVDGHLYQTRNLDWNLEIGAHNFAAIVIYVPDAGSPHVVPTFAGFCGAHTGMNFHGIALSEMGDALRKEAPYFVHAPHFTAFFRTMLY